MADDDDKTLICPSIFCIVVAAILSFGFWSKFVLDLDFQMNQQPAVCYDGRRMGEDLMDARIGVDDTQRSKGTITMRCNFAVAVYPCHDDNIDPSDWDGHCRILSDSPMYPDDQWPRRIEDSDMSCRERDGISGDRCSDKKWSCTGIGDCDGYEKAARLCASRLKGPYACFTSEGDDEVREDASGFPVGWLIAGLLAGCCGIGLCGMATHVLSEGENCTKAVAKSMLTAFIAVGVVGGIIMIIVAIIRAATGEPDRRGIVETKMKDVAIATGFNETLVVAAESPPEGMHWGYWVLIILGSVVFFMCVGVWIMGGPKELLEECDCFFCFSSTSRSAATKASDSESQSNSAAGAPGTIGNALAKAKPESNEKVTASAMRGLQPEPEP